MFMIYMNFYFCSSFKVKNSFNWEGDLMCHASWCLFCKIIPNFSFNILLDIMQRLVWYLLDTSGNLAVPGGFMWQTLHLLLHSIVTLVLSVTMFMPLWSHLYICLSRYTFDSKEYPDITLQFDHPVFKPKHVPCVLNKNKNCIIKYVLMCSFFKNWNKWINRWIKQ